MEGTLGASGGQRGLRKDLEAVWGGVRHGSGPHLVELPSCFAPLVRVWVLGKRKAERGGEPRLATGGQRSESESRGSGRGMAAPASPPGCRSPAPTARGAHDAGRAGRSPYRGRSRPNGRPVAAHAWSGGEVRRFLRRLFRRRRRQSWEEAVAAGGSPRSGRRLEVTSRAELERPATSAPAPLRNSGSNSLLPLCVSAGSAPSSREDQ